MKTTLPTLLLIILSASCVYAQKSDRAIGLSTYQFIHIRDTTNRDKPYQETMVLLLGKNAAVYKSLSKQRQEEVLAKQIAEQVKKASDPNRLDLTITGNGATTNQEVYQYVNDKKLFTEEKIINYYLVQEPLPLINWMIQKDTMTIRSLHCQKAIAHFKGRDYQAWFCPDLPFSNGPWKLNGLPGLIIEATDLKKEIQFKFMGFEDISNSDQKIVPPADDIKTTPKELTRLIEARQKDPQGFSKASMGGNSERRNSGLSMGGIDPNRIASINVIKAPDANSAINNNPLELPEKK